MNETARHPERGLHGKRKNRRCNGRERRRGAGDCAGFCKAGLLRWPDRARNRRAWKPPPAKARRRKRRALPSLPMSPTREAVEARGGPRSNASSALSTFGSMSAMTTVYAPFDEITPDEYKRATEVTYLGYVYGTMAALSRMSRREPGHYRAGRLGARPIAPSRCRRPIAARNSRSAASPTPAVRTDPRPLEHPPHDGAVAGAEHAAIQLGPR